MKFASFALAAVIFIICLILEIARPFYSRFYVERDPALSYPLVQPQTVPTWLLMILAWFLPAIVLGLLQLLGFFRPVTLPLSSLAAGIIFTNLVVVMIVDCLKCTCSRLRPNYFALCDYKGYADVLTGKEGAYDIYMQATLPGRVGNDEFCRTPNRNAHLSFPSGHTAWSFASWAFFSYCLVHGIRKRRLPRIVEICSVLLPFALASWIGCTRIQDYWHNVDDVLAGALIGWACGWGSFSAIVAPYFKARDDTQIAFGEIHSPLPAL